MDGPVLRTERLWLRPFAVADVPALHALFTDPVVRRYLLDDEVVPRRWTEAEVERSRRSFAAHGHGLWAVAPEQGGPPVGFTGYREFREPPVLELIYGLDPDHHGRGLASEATRAAIAYGFDSLGLDPIRASLDAPNLASLRLAHRVGFHETHRTSGPLHEQIHLELPRDHRGS